MNFGIYDWERKWVLRSVYDDWMNIEWVKSGLKLTEKICINIFWDITKQSMSIMLMEINLYHITRPLVHK